MITGRGLGVRVLAGCEFSVAAPWGEMHLLGYYLPLGHGPLDEFLEQQRQWRAVRMEQMVQRLSDLGVELTVEDVREQAGGSAVGRPHVARALVARGVVPDVARAFDRYLGRGCPAFVAKHLPALREVTDLVRSVGGVTSAAHLGRRATRRALAKLKDLGVDAVEARHPSHDEGTSAKIERAAEHLGMLLTGGSDWHGGGKATGHGGSMGGVPVPGEWLAALDEQHDVRSSTQEVAS